MRHLGSVRSSPTHHASSLHSLREDSCVRLTPENVTLELLRAAISDHCEGVTVMADTQKGEEAHLTLPEWLVLSERKGGVRLRPALS